MFGNGGKKKPSKGRHAGTALSSLGLMDIPGTDEFGNISLDDIDDDDDGELEAELNAIAYGGSKARKPIKKKNVVSSSALQNMVDVCMQDLPSDDEHEDIESENIDTDLLNELEGLAEVEDTPYDQTHDTVKNTVAAPVVNTAVEREPCDAALPCAGAGMLGTIDSRIAMYTAAQEKAKAKGESSKVRRFARALTTLNQLKRNVNAGKGIREDDIPPPLATTSYIPGDSGTSSPASSEVASPEAEHKNILPSPLEHTPSQGNSLIQTKEILPNTVLSVDTHQQDIIHNNSSPKTKQNKMSEVKSQRDKYKSFALQSKTTGDRENAVWGLKAVKLCDTLISKLEKGEYADFDLSTLPEIPSSKEADVQKAVKLDQVPHPPKLQRTFSRDDPIQIPDNPEDIPPPDPSAPTPNTIEEALNQRLAKYREDEAKAKEQGNGSRARRLGRICKQYEDAIKLHKRGKPIPVAELPTPPGYSEIPTLDSKTAPSMDANPNIERSLPTSGNGPEINVTKQSVTNIAPTHKPSMSKQRSLTVQEKQLALLEKRQAMFKSAALEAKRAGQIEQAKEYLRSSKGFDKLIEASKGGLPVDISTLPVPPQSITNVDMGFTIVSKEDGMHISQDLDNKSRQEMYLKLETDIKSQIKMCEANQKHFKVTGDVASANKFQQMSEHTKKDLDALRFAYKRGDPVPKFHYEVRAFSIIVCNADLTDHEMELTLERGINYNVTNPKEVHTYCRIEFPYPKETPFKDKTITIKDTNNPEYNHKIMIPVNIKEKACQRVFKRGIAKVEVLSKGGFLRGDTLLGTASVKLGPLETSCTLHDTFPLMDGRKAVGGKVEVLIKLRNAVVTKQVEKREEKWLVISFR